MGTYYIILQRFRFSVWIWICRLAGGTLRRICWATDEFIAICNSVLLHFSFIVWLRYLLLALDPFACMVLFVSGGQACILLLQTCFHSRSQHLLWQWSLSSAIRYPCGLLLLSTVHCRGDDGSVHARQHVHD